MALAGGILALDRMTVRVMLSSPLVAAPLVSALLGMPLLGLLTGILFQLLWIRETESTAKWAPDAGFAALVASAITASLIGPLSTGERLMTLWPYGIAFGIILSPLAGSSRWFVANWLSQRLSDFDAAVTRADVPAIRRLISFAASVHFLTGALLAGISYFMGYTGWALFKWIWFEADPILLTIVPLIAGLAIASVARLFLHRDTVLAFVLGAIGFTVLELIRRSSVL
ncbi:MAG: PTS sugar transporter subunit IIC [bacterium]|nr:PTS sugar transporter subunit IIC [bacterium]